MASKYIEGQKVKIVPVKDQHMHLKHKRIEPLVSKSGTIVDFYFVISQEPSRGEGSDLPRENYFYTVRIGNKEVKGIPEECLEPMR